LHKISELVGYFPIVLSSPDEYNLTLGPPPGRRKFVDIVLSQIYRKYFSYLQDYHRIIQQRNVILSKWKFSGVKNASIIEPWDQRLVEVGCKIIEYRKEFSESFSNILQQIYAELVTTKEVLTFDYRANIGCDDIEKMKADFSNRLKQSRQQEIQRGTSLAGPHRDDFIFKIDQNELRKFGSRGQHKTVLISLAMAQFDLIQNKINEVPIILIDDLFSEIDRERKNKIIDRLNNLGQVFITATSLYNDNLKNTNDSCFSLVNGTAKKLID